MGFLKQALLPVAVFAVVSALAEVAGAANLGTAFGFGQIAFAVTVLGQIAWR